MKERRGKPRIPLDNVMYITAVTAGRQVQSVLLDISVSGARIGFPPHEALPPIGAEVVLQDASLLAPYLENRAATVMWGKGVQFGVQFTQQIDEHLEHIAKLLHSEIFHS